MSREIKFRAWIPSEKSMIQHREVIDRVHNQFEDKFNTSDIVMQYTGLKDMNGIEIYEGDILQHIKYGSTGVMEWDNDGWTKFYPIINFGIIGNIHQNPELS